MIDVKDMAPVAFDHEAAEAETTIGMIYRESIARDAALAEIKAEQASFNARLAAFSEQIARLTQSK